ncbi:MAG: septum site-determining protein MinD, partial [Methanoregula sp.]|nr:septum site-determining protein MinD [Methanoregula sp.]
VVGGHVLGTIINRVDQDKSEIISKKMEKVLGVKVLGIIPEDPNVRRAAAARSPLVIKYPDSPASKAIQQIASGLIGVAYKEEEVKTQKDGFIERFSKALFKKKSDKQ